MLDEVALRQFFSEYLATTLNNIPPMALTQLLPRTLCNLCSCEPPQTTLFKFNMLHIRALNHIKVIITTKCIMCILSSL
jgi:hypothetical protein